MPDEISDDDRQKLLRLGIITQELALLMESVRERRRWQKSLVIDLVEREVISQARAARISEVTRQTVMSWVNQWPAPVITEQDLPPADKYPVQDLKLPWRPGLDLWTE